MDKSLFMSQLYQCRVQLEANTADFIKRVKDHEDSLKKKNRRHVDRYKSGKSLEHYYQGVMADNEGNTVVKFKIPSSKNKNASNPRDYKFYYCFIDIIPKNTTLFNLAKAKAKLGERIQILKDADIKFFCTCPDFNWSGMKYNAKHINHSFISGQHASDARDDHGEDIDPIVRDPEHKTTMCKHLVAACSGLLTNATSIMKDARNFVPEKKEEPEKTIEMPLGKKEEPEQKEAEEQAKEFFEEVPGFKTEETTEALNTLADTMSEEAKENPGLGVIGDNQNVDDTAETSSDEIEGDPSLGIIGETTKPEETQEAKPNNLADFASESELDMYNQPVDDEPEPDYEEEDNEKLKNAPLRLPV